MKKIIKEIYSDRDFINKPINEAEDFVDATEDKVEETADDFVDASESLTEDVVNEAEGAEKTMTDEELKIESLKIATNIAKLMSNVTPQDIVTIAGTVSDFIKNHEIGSASASDDFLSDNTGSEEAEEEAPAEEPAADEFETGDEMIDEPSEDSES